MPLPSRLIFGFHSVLAKLRHDPGAVHEINVDSARREARLRDLLEHAAFARVRVLPMESARLAAIAPGARHQGVIATVEARQRHVVLDTFDEPAFLLVLDGIQDPHNLGACLRVADAVGAHAAIAPKDRAVGLTQTVVKVASGAAEMVPYLSPSPISHAPCANSGNARYGSSVPMPRRNTICTKLGGRPPAPGCSVPKAPACAG